jgi:hypothetical protein
MITLELAQVEATSQAMIAAQKQKFELSITQVKNKEMLAEINAAVSES